MASTWLFDWRLPDRGRLWLTSTTIMRSPVVVSLLYHAATACLANDHFVWLAHVCGMTSPKIFAIPLFQLALIANISKRYCFLLQEYSYLVTYRTGVIADQSFTLREWGFSTFLVQWHCPPWPDDFCIRSSPILARDMPDVRMSFLRQGFCKSSCYRHTHGYTDSQICTCSWNGISCSFVGGQKR